MGKLAFFLHFILAVFPIDASENRRHIHVIYKGKKKSKTHRGNTVAKIWIEENGSKNIEVDWTTLSASEMEPIITAVDANWDFIMRQIDAVFKGNKVRISTLKK